MTDENIESRSKRGALRERIRSILRGAASTTLQRLRRTRERTGDAIDSTARRLKQSEVGERLCTALETRRVLKKAEAAHARGNPSMAYRLLDQELRAKPSDEQLAVAFWRTCVVLERGSEAAEPLLRVIRRRASAGNLEEAARLWCELTDVVVDARADAGTLIRIAAVLQEPTPHRAVLALRAALEPETQGLTTGLATRIVEQSSELDPPTALLATQWMLQSDDLAAEKRARLEAWVTEFEQRVASDAVQPAPANPAAPALEPAAIESREPSNDQHAQEKPDPDHAQFIVEQTLEPLAPSSRFSSVKATEVVSQSLTDDSLKLELHDGRNARLDYTKVQAVGVAEVAGLAPEPVVLIDLALNWHSGDGEELRVVRLRADRFADPPNAGEKSESLRSILAVLFSRTAAEPLPSMEAARGDRLRFFDDIGCYEREVLLAG